MRRFNNGRGVPILVYTKEVGVHVGVHEAGLRFPGARNSMIIKGGNIRQVVAGRGFEPPTFGL
jgi:hypothetical protein